MQNEEGGGGEQEGGEEFQGGHNLCSKDGQM